MTKDDIRQLQHGLNQLYKDSKLGPPLIADGEMGPATKERIRSAKFFLGYRGKINDDVNDEFLHRLWHPNAVRYSTRSRVLLGKKRRAAHRARNARIKIVSYIAPGITRFDGVPVRASMVPIMLWARHRGWKGRLISGWRDPVYSRSLCMRMCGRPSCPGRCAGMSSNHVRTAIDVSDYVRFGQLMHECPLQPKIFNALGARDPVHFSPNGR